MAYEYVIFACLCATMCVTQLNAAAINKIANEKSLSETKNERLQDQFGFEDVNESMSVSATDDADAEELTPFGYSAKLEAEILELRGTEREQKTDRKYKRLPRSITHMNCPVHFIRKNGKCIPCQKLGGSC